ncbi:DegT/DnrJ/EryC1/StrS family aminotransferase [Ichthyenterobacterium sp. W332]|uniref:DegT/DnrJ/EryC1/StrS family aminotransferase n=1 Tax=Microcosmobacter mediterraneus TaxID=3075607 RepID=A0ABU2YN72_9FLAO|nr:DegT/DnrJ/EryC1/StrS family aminotransferase [Ichthyenterobacterium sp. W332]MDT0559245.1 DegT/DnrJ/EryC1/StrS family aminotransferase [Ichthyenterobacterium sp. W332]
MIKFLDLQRINARFNDELSLSMQKVMESGHFILGDCVSAFEKQFAAYCGTNYCIGTASGLDALTLILKGYIQLGRLNKGDEIIVPANTFYATVLSVIQADLKPILVEPQEDTLNISPEKVKVLISSKTKAIIAVQLYGQLADMNTLKVLADTHDLLLIEDAAQAHGAEDDTGNRAGNLSDAAAFSFYPSKNLGALGDGGAITTSDSDLDAILRSIRNYGSDKKYKYQFLGLNSRLDELQAAFLSVKLKYLDTDNTKRRAFAKLYLDKINNSKVTLPNYNVSKSHVYYVFALRVADRVEFMNHLKQDGIETHIHYPIAPHQQKSLSEFNHLHLPITESIHNSIVSIPLSPVMTESEIQQVIDIVNTY